MLTFTDDRHSVDEHVLYAGGIPVWIIKFHGDDFLVTDIFAK